VNQLSRHERPDVIEDLAVGLATATQGPTSSPGFSSWPDRPFETLLVVALAGASVGGVLSEGHTGQVLGSPRSSTARGACYPPT
jgi:hypothetical protein